MLKKFLLEENFVVDESFEIIDIETPLEIEVIIPEKFFYSCLLRSLSGLYTEKRYIGVAKIQNICIPAWYIDISNSTADFYPM